MAPPSKRNSMAKMEIDDGSGSAMMMEEEKKKEEEPERMSRIELEREEYRVRWRAAHAGNKLVAAWWHQDRLKRKNMTKTQLIQEQLFFSNDIDFNRINLSDAPARRGHVSGKVKIKKPKPKLKPAPAGGTTFPAPEDMSDTSDGLSNF